MTNLLARLFSRPPNRPAARTTPVIPSFPLRPLGQSSGWEPGHVFLDRMRSEEAWVARYADRELALEWSIMMAEKSLGATMECVKYATSGDADPRVWDSLLPADARKCVELTGRLFGMRAELHDLRAGRP